LPELEQKLKKKTAVIGVVGLGYVGLPSAVAFARAGFNVLGFDIQPEKVALVNKGQSTIEDIDSGLIRDMVAKELLRATTDQSRLKETDVICICVPTPLTAGREPDMSYILRASEEVARHIQPGQLVVLESTTYPGTTRGTVLTILERSGLKAGADFYLAYSPERIDPGNKTYSIKNTPKLVGGIDSPSTGLAGMLYRQIADEVLLLSCPEAAEMAKIFENIFRNVNIALVNELAQLCEKMEINVWEVIRAAATKPFGYMPFYPGPGIGGHCIPLDPHYLASRAREYGFQTRFIELAAEINEQMPYHVISQIMEALNNRGGSLKGAEVLVLGAAYKKDVGDIRESPTLKLIELLNEEGARVSYHDPYLPRLELPNGTLTSVELTEGCLSSADCVVIATAHSSYDVGQIARQAKLIYDTRGVTLGLKSDNIIRLGEGISGSQES